jgi:hypothetical protein
MPFELERAAMPASVFDRTASRNHAAPMRRPLAQWPVAESDRDADAMVEWEFSEAMRPPGLPAGWFVLPSAAMGCLLLFAFLH